MGSFVFRVHFRPLSPPAEDVAVAYVLAFFEDECVFAPLPLLAEDAAVYSCLTSFEPLTGWFSFLDVPSRAFVQLWEWVLRSRIFGSCSRLWNNRCFLHYFIFSASVLRSRIFESWPIVRGTEVFLRIFHILLLTAPF